MKCVCKGNMKPAVVFTVGLNSYFKCDTCARSEHEQAILKCIKCQKEYDECVCEDKQQRVKKIKKVLGEKYGFS